MRQGSCGSNILVFKSSIQILSISLSCHARKTKKPIATLQPILAFLFPFPLLHKSTSCRLCGLHHLQCDGAFSRVQGGNRYQQKNKCFSSSLVELSSCLARLLGTRAGTKFDDGALLVTSYREALRIVLNIARDRYLTVSAEHK